MTKREIRRGERFRAWSLKEVVALVERKGELSISWRYRDKQMRNMARRAVRAGLIRRAKGAPGADHFARLPAPTVKPTAPTPAPASVAAQDATAEPTTLKPSNPKPRTTQPRFKTGDDEDGSESDASTGDEQEARPSS